MAKNYYNAKPKKKVNVGAIVAVTASVLALAIGACAVGIGTSGYRDWAFSRWFPKTETVTPAPEASAGGNAVITENEGNGMRLMSARVMAEDYAEYGVSPLVENVYSLSVTYTPADTTFQETTFTAKFKDPTSTWATGKNVEDYVKVTSTGKTTATVEILQQFSEQVIITATCDRNPAIKATTTVDYVCTGLNYSLPSGYVDAGTEDIYLTDFSWSEGTVAPDTDITFVYRLDEAVYNRIQAAGFNVERYYKYNMQYDSLVDANSETYTTLKNVYLEVVNYSTLSAEKQKEYTYLLGQMFADYSDGDGCGQYCVSYNRVYNGVDYGGYDCITDANANWLDWDRGSNFSEAFEIVATSMTTNSSSIIAG